MSVVISPGRVAPVNSGILVYGAGGHAEVVAEIAALNGLRVAAFAVDPDYYVCRGGIASPPTIPGDDESLRLILDAGVTRAICGIGDCASRQRVTDRLDGIGFRLITLTHPASIISPSAKIGLGCVICAGAIISTNAVLGDGVIVNTAASVDHDCNVWSFAHISPGARLCGRVKVGTITWVGAGATVREGIRVGHRSIVGAGSVVIRDVPPESVVYGVPAKVRKPDPAPEPTATPPRMSLSPDVPMSSDVDHHLTT